MSAHRIKRGLDIPIKGVAEGEIVPLEAPATVAYSPTEFRGITPRLDAREGAEVKAGEPLFHAKKIPEMRFLSPVAGRVVEVRRGYRRVITDVVVERTGDAEASLPVHEPGALKSIGRDAARDGLLAGGLWPHLRTRPLDNVADPAVTPQAILIGAMETGPLQPGPDVLLSADDAEFVQAGARVLKALTDGPVHLAVEEGSSHPALSGVEGVERHTFRGPHPAGDPALQVNLVQPPVGQGQVWYLRAWEAALIGRLFLEGRFPTERVYAAVGAGTPRPRYVRTLLGAPLAQIVDGTTEGENRWIRGSVLTGEQVESDRWASFYARAVHLLPEEVQREFLGWALPQIGRWSAHRAFLSGGGRRDLRPALRGGHRALVPVEMYRKVVATPDIDAVYLFKSVIAGDLEESIKLGMLDLTREEAALLTFVCPSKIEYDVLLDEGLQRYEKEM